MKEAGLRSSLERWDSAVSKRRRRQAALHATEEQLHVLLEGVQEYAVFLLDAEGYVTSWNAGAERIWGYRNFEIVGQHFSRCYTAEDTAAGKPQRCLQVAAREGRWREEGLRLRRDGSVFWAEVITAPLHDPAGNLSGFAKLTRDITKLKYNELKLRESEENLRLLVEEVRDCAIFKLDEQGYVSSWNGGAEKCVGYRAHEIIGRHFSAFFTDADAAAGKPAQALETAVRSGRYHEERPSVRGDGSLLWSDMQITPLRDSSGGLRGYIGLVRDISERKRTHEELLRTRGELRQMARALARNLREPIGRIASYADLIREGFGERLDEQSRQWLRGIEADAALLRDLTGALIDYSAVSLSESVLAAADCEAAFGHAFADLTAEIERRGAIVTHDRLPIVLGDERLLADVFRHLIGNALKFHQPQRQPVVHVGAHRDLRSWRFFVRDNGLGVIAEDCERIFGLFERLDGRAAGIGTGLALCKKIVELHGGQIWVASEPGQGATFFFTLPALARSAG